MSLFFYHRNLVQTISALLLSYLALMNPLQAQEVEKQVDHLVTAHEDNFTAAIKENSDLEASNPVNFVYPPVLFVDDIYGSNLYLAGSYTYTDPNDPDYSGPPQPLPNDSRTSHGPATIKTTSTPGKYSAIGTTLDLFGIHRAYARYNTQFVKRSNGDLITSLIRTGSRNPRGLISRENMYPATTQTYTEADYYGNTLLSSGALVRLDGDGAYANIISSTLNKLYLPYGRLAKSIEDEIYGLDEGPKGYGRIYKLSAGNEFSIIHEFEAPAQGVGQWPNDIILGSDGWLYGILAYGRGIPRYSSLTKTDASTPTGVVFKINPKEKSSYKILHEFTLSEGEFNVEHQVPSEVYESGDSERPWNAATRRKGQNTLIEGPDGKIYGSSSISHCSIYTKFNRWISDVYGTYGSIYPSTLCGEIKGSLDKNSAANLTNTKYVYLEGSEVYDVEFNRNGTIFRIDTDGNNFEIIHRFDGTNGMTPRGPMVFIGNTLYGTTLAGGHEDYYYGNGEYDIIHVGWKRGLNLASADDYNEDDYAHKASHGIFFALHTDKLSQDGDQAYEVVHQFNQETTGRAPTGVTLGEDGVIYGSTQYGGAQQWFDHKQNEYSYANVGAFWRYGPKSSSSINISLDPATIKLGESARLSWVATDVVPGSCEALSSQGDWQGVQAESGLLDMTKSESGVYNYSMSCISNSDGKSVGSNTVILRVNNVVSENDGYNVSYSGGGVMSGAGISFLTLLALWRFRLRRKQLKSQDERRN
jgi:hypothetical protein